MTEKTLFSIILKVLGILFLKDILLSIPQILSLIVYSLSNDYEGGKFGTVALIILFIGAYFLVAYWLLFKTDRLIEKFKLDQGFEVDPIRLNIHRSTLLSICLIVIGGLMFVNALPLLVKAIVNYYQEAKMIRFEPDSSPDKTYLVNYGLQVITGLLLMGNQRQIVNFIELRRRNKIEDEENPSE